MSIRARLILWYSGLLVVILLMLGIAVYGIMNRVLTSTIDQQLDTASEHVRTNSRATAIGEFGTPSEITVQLPQLDVFGLSGVLVQVWKLSSTPLELIDYSANIGNYRDPLDGVSLNELAQKNISTVIYANINKNGSEWRVRTQSLNVWGQRIAIQVAASSQAIKTGAEMLIVVMLWTGVLSVVGSILLGILVTTRTLRPIKQITVSANRIAAADDLKTRLPWNGPMDELGRLVSVFNKMMARLEQLFSVQQRFVADVSHELRTPLTAIRGNLDIIKRYGMDDESFNAIESETERMTRMVNDLLLLARADYGDLRIELETVDVDTIMSEVYREARVLAKEREITVTLGTFEPVRVNGNSDRLKQLVLNLVSNAIKFTPHEGTITLILRNLGESAVIEVRDTGIGISEEDQTRLFDRFFQADSSRARHSSQGVGLGLSIAKWIVDGHKGKITVKSALGKGTTFIITLPTVDQTPKPSFEQALKNRNILMRRRNDAQD